LLSGVCHRLSSSVTLHGGPASGFTCAGQAMTSCRLQSDYSSTTVTLHGEPVVLRPVRATPCWKLRYTHTIMIRTRNKYARLRGRPYIHTCRSCVHVTLWSHQLEHSSSFTLRPIRPILGFWGAKFPKMCDFQPWTPINRRAKFEAASFVFVGEIRNRINYKPTHKKKQTNSKRYIHTLPTSRCG